MPPISDHRRRYMREYMKARRMAEREARLAAGESVSRGRPKKERLPPPQSDRREEVERVAILCRQELYHNWMREVSFFRFERLCQSRWNGYSSITRKDVLRAIYDLVVNGWLQPPQYSRRGLPKMLAMTRKQR
jgi:hypothetical protein